MPKLAKARPREVIEVIQAHTESLTVIGAHPSDLHIGQLWQHRRLIYLFIWRDLKARYKQTVLGALWAILQPLLTMGVFTFVFRRIARIPTDGIPYPVFVLCGLLPWQFVSQAVTRSSNSLVNDRYLLTRIYVPRVVLPISAVLSGLPDFAIAFLAGLMVILFYGVLPTANLLLVFPFLLFAVATSIGIGLVLSMLHARYRDVGYLIPFAMQLWFFVSPVIYPSSLVPGKLRSIYLFNPMATVIDGFRMAIAGAPTLIGATMASAGIVCGALIAALWFFQRLDRSYADVV